MTSSDPSTSQQSAPEAWQRLVSLLEPGPDSVLLKRKFPPGKEELALLEALGHEHVPATQDEHELASQLAEQLSGLTNHMHVFAQVSRCPIIAITGLLNAGKSSLLASYLSTENRGRVLRGLSNEAGTHRFVLWLPQVWKEDAELLSTLIGFLSSLFGHPPEQLSQDPEVASLQYNGRIVTSEVMRSESGSPQAISAADTDPLVVPLIAYDAALDALRVGLVDCPDIQTGYLSSPHRDSGEDLAATRREQLAILGRLCSAFVVVSKLNSLHDSGLLRILQTLRDAMPGVPRLLAVNKIKSRYSPEVVLEQTKGLVDRFSIQSVYIAYDFRSSLAHTRVPPAPPQMNVEQDEDPLPIFFSPSLKAEETTHEGLSYLHELGQQLNTSSLSLESSRSLRNQLKVKTIEATSWVEKNQGLRHRQIRDAWQAVADACYEFMAERDGSGSTTGLRLQASPAIVAQMADSLYRTAPFWMRPSLSIDRSVRQLRSAISDSAARFKILQNASESVTQFAKRFRRGEGAQVVTPDRLAKAVRTNDIHDSLKMTPKESLRAGCELAMKRFGEEDKTELNETELDEWSKQVWSGMTMKDKLWRSTKPLAILTAPLLAVVLIPIDGGGTTFLVFASAKELLAAAGISAVFTPMATGGEASGIVQRETPWRQLSDLFAILCDSLGLPRPDSESLPVSKCEGRDRQLLPSSLETKGSTVASAAHEWEVHVPTMEQIQLALKQL